MIKAVIFDFDGTLADTFLMNLHALNEHADRFGYKKINNPGKLRGKEAFEIITHEMGIPLWKLPYLMWQGKRIIREQVKNAELFPGIVQVIKKLQKKYTVGILTSNSKENVEAVLKKHKLTVPLIFSSGMFSKEGSLTKLLKNNGFKKEEVVYVGDEIRDVNACKKVGIKIIAISWGYNLPESLKKVGATIVVNKPSEIISFVNKQ